MAVNLELVPAVAGKRLGAAVLDWLAPAVVLVVAFTIGFSSVTRTQSGGFIVYDTGTLVVFGSIGIALVLIYMVVLMTWEGRSGNSIGNRLMGIRSADSDGFAPGAAGVFVRGVVTGAGMLFAAIAAIMVLAFQWFGLALWILGPLALLGAVWAVAVVVSNSWDNNGKLRGWHDSAAKTIVFDVTAGRNPVTTGGIQGPYSFAPLDLPPVQRVSSPVAGANTTPQVINAQASLNPNMWQAPGTLQPAAAQHPAGAQPSAPVVPQPASAFSQHQPATIAPQAPASAEQMPEPQHQFHPDDDHDRTQMRGGAQQPPAPVAVLRIRLDDGRDFQLDRSVLIGRNPAAQTGEQHALLLAVHDPGRSISKTHLHVLTDGAGIWVTDRNSTNGSAVSTPDGIRTSLQAGVPVFVSPGSAVHFGDRTFHLGQA
ncbi:RDD family protein [Pseudarthrobacter sp. N5]|uniref:RDD family protein n=1 Tax=Pseudarthrobacter sp. N5 TaxID=3418416 RepID=UPI003CF85C93